MVLRYGFLLGLLVLAIGCDSESTGPEENDPDPPSGLTHECVPYQSSEFDAEDNGGWSAPNTVIERSITIPDDRGGGYVTYRAWGGRGCEPAFFVTNGSGGGAITGGSSATTSTPNTRIGGFAVAPGETYDVEVHDFFNCTHYQPVPCPMEFSWTYHPLEDCYEPNDSRDEAKAIPVEETISAYMIGGYVGNYYLNDRLDDWYSFTLEEEAEVSVQIFLGPGDIRMWYQVPAELGGVWLSDSATFEGEYPLTSTGILPAGTYFIHVGAVQTEGEWSQERTMPDAFRHKYYLTVNVDPDEDPVCDPVEPVFSTAPVTGSFDSFAGSYSFTRTAMFEGAGFVQFSVGGPVEPRLTVEAAGEVISTAESINGQVEVYFEAKPGVTYTYRIEQELEAPSYPAPFYGQYTLRNRNDCFEPNDDRAQAREIPENYPIQAYLFAGHDGVAPAAADYADWYRFDLLLRSTIELDIDEFPATVVSRVRLYDETGTQIRELSPAGIETIDWGEIAAGNYYLAFEPVTVLSSATGVGPDVPPHFNLPYSFSIETMPVP